MLQDKIFCLKGKVQHYAWGGYDFIPAWLGIANEKREPFAEYWMGAHPSASSEIKTPHGWLSLHELIADQHEEMIGEKVYNTFGELPYLFKILDVRDMLSIQVHPTKEAAAAGFEDEEKRGIVLSSSIRNYKDKNHKPEVMIALSEFWLLHGFLKQDKLKAVLDNTPAFRGLKEHLKDNDYKALYSYVMNLSQDDADEMLLPLVKDAVAKKKEGNINKSQPEWWVAKLYGNDEEPDHIDKGVFSIYFFNIVCVQPGEAVFQGAGVPHAYLEGQNVELMANSDNVLRGGLTPKNIDVPELLKHTKFEGIEPFILKGNEENKGEKIYHCPVPDFGISKIELNAGESLSSTSNSLEIITIMDGSCTISNHNELVLQKGQCAAVLHNENYRISTDSHVVAYKAFVP